MNANDGLYRQVRWSARVAVLCILLAFGAYASNFYLNSVSSDPARWGEFGDYIGGVLNPLIALLAFYWLIRSILLQKLEMQRSSEALISSALHQQAMAEQAARSAHINALSALLETVNLEISFLRSRVAQIDNDIVAHNRTTNESGRVIGARHTVDIRQRLGIELEQAMESRASLEGELRRLIEQDAECPSP